MRSLLVRYGLVVLSTWLFSSLFVSGSRADARVLEAAGGGEVRALIVGIDAYQHYRPLKGAVADARDIATALRSVGVKDVVTLIDAAADRAGLIGEIERLVSRTKANDLVL